jgi:choline monooxygenase
MSPFHIDSDISRAKTIPTSFYLEPAYFALASEKIFARTWHFVGDLTQVKDPGWVTPVSLLDKCLDEPLLLSRDNEGTLHCLSNVCTHRGNLLVERPCKLRDIRCRYHGRRFSLNGEFQSMPEFKEVQDFPTDEDNLKKVPLFQFKKWLFASINPVSAAEEFLGSVINRISWMPLEEFRFRPELSRDYTVNAHWALYCENYLEGFHIPFVHAGLNTVIDYSKYTTELYSNASLQLGLAKDDEAIFEIPTTSQDHGKKIAGYYFWVFPNIMFNFYPWGLSINIVRPVTASQSIVSFLSYVWDENKLRQGAGANLHQVEMEDEDIVEQVQKGIRSRFYRQGRYSVKMEKGTHHFHRLLTKYLFS